MRKTVPIILIRPAVIEGTFYDIGSRVKVDNKLAVQLQDEKAGVYAKRRWWLRR